MTRLSRCHVIWLLPHPPPYPVSKLSLFLSLSLWVELTDGRGGRGWWRSQIIGRREHDPIWHWIKAVNLIADPVSGGKYLRIQPDPGYYLDIFVSIEKIRCPKGTVHNHHKIDRILSFSSGNSLN